MEGDDFDPMAGVTSALDRLDAVLGGGRRSRAAKRSTRTGTGPGEGKHPLHSTSGWRDDDRERKRRKAARAARKGGRR